MQILGIDVGGSGIKGAPVDITTGELLAERHRVATPTPATPAAIADVVAEIARHFAWSGEIGCGFPAAIQRGVARTAANIHRSWIGTDAAALFSEATGCATKVVNDADAAGLAELHFGAGRDREGVLIMVTVGTGLGTAIFNDGVLLPNTELGHIELRGREAERWASDATRKRKDLSWKRWARRFGSYLHTLERLFWPDLFIIGGGASKKHEKFVPRLDVAAQVVPAQLRNQAGIVGAALAVRPRKLAA
ncbi:polyphosphate--glucose phosphotransferase [Haliangium ochraceum]|uniref:ROK family protein n=1 Tax=Haliangium ochraceum (strain DSM 14365 / JCM 11303 / SMP-2) TaxID=502025 RepID=D0LTR6_HALO1|nr:ROK family protein [Haliangium ochraceum]ACY15760.1 ROK family protein [Haliangium ochraceum DSM 14365]